MLAFGFVEAIGIAEGLAVAAPDSASGKLCSDCFFRESISSRDLRVRIAFCPRFLHPLPRFFAYRTALLWHLVSSIHLD
jgi:hypothetical protein